MPRRSPAPPRFERRVDGIDYGVLDELVGHALRRAQTAIHLDFERALGPDEMTPQRFSSLVVIAGNPGITQRDLGYILGIARSGVVQLVNGLASRGWAIRRPDATDARAWRLHLTAAGRKHLVKVRRRVREHDRRIGARLDAAQRESLMRLLERLGPDE